MGSSWTSGSGSRLRRKGSGWTPRKSTGVRGPLPNPPGSLGSMAPGLKAPGWRANEGMKAEGPRMGLQSAALGKRNGVKAILGSRPAGGEAGKEKEEEGEEEEETEEEEG